MLTRADIIPDVVRGRFEIVEVELAPRDDVHDTLRDEVVVLRTLQAHLRCGEIGRITPVVAEAAVDAEHAAQRARVGLDRALTGRTDEHLGARALGSERVVRVERAVGGVATGVQSVHRADAVRSEEHTSELQSLMRISYAVF